MEGDWDVDDELPPVTYFDIYWHYANRAAEWGMWYVRSLGITIGRIPHEMRSPELQKRGGHEEKVPRPPKKP